MKCGRRNERRNEDRSMRFGRQFWNPWLFLLYQHCHYPGNSGSDLLPHCCTFEKIRQYILPSLQPQCCRTFHQKIFLPKPWFSWRKIWPKYSSGENWSKRWFPLRIIRRWVIFIWKEKAEEPISRGIKADNKWLEQKTSLQLFGKQKFSEEELDTKKCQQKLSGHDSWEEEYASSWKRNVISWGGVWIRKVAFPLQKLRITGSSTRPQQLERKNWPRQFHFTLNPNFQHWVCNRVVLSDINSGILSYPLNFLSLMDLYRL